ncbi:hypothetical protein Fmac_028642 [Flemingia macrophylla]|uniref:Ribosomal protein S7 n=1 Tax=Flemingia macrophylla TaxID=520843 RepID=A0ABD1L8F7_9FABA
MEKMAPNSIQLGSRNDAIVIRGVHDVAIVTSTKTRKFDGKLDALVNLVTQLAANQKPSSIARVCGIRSSNDHHTSKAGRQAYALVNLVNQLASNKKPAYVARVYDIRSSNDHHTSVVLHRKQLEWMSILRLMANTYSRPPHSRDTRNLILKMGPNSLQFKV